MKLFNKKKSKAKSNLKGRVQCNESCVIRLEKEDEDIPGIIHEFNWLGFVVDHIDERFRETLKLNEGEEVQIQFKLPREFGGLEVKTSQVIVSEYQETVDGKSRLRMEVNLEGKEQLDSVRDFVSYRNRRFSRHHSSRRSMKFLKSYFVLKWFFFIPSFILAIVILFNYLFKD